MIIASLKARAATRMLAGRVQCQQKWSKPSDARSASAGTRRGVFEMAVVNDTVFQVRPGMLSDDLRVSRAHHKRQIRVWLGVAPERVQ